MMCEWKRFRKFGGLLLVTVLLISGCGRKEAPQIHGDAGEKPQIVGLQYEVVGNVLQLSFTLVGDANGVGYQIDRTQMDPYCQCLGRWRRYYERPPFAEQVGKSLTKPINLKTDKVEFIYRIRAVDTFGNLGSWSKAIHARAVDLSK